MKHKLKSYNAQTYLAYALIAPAALYIVLIVAWPLLETIRLSFTNSSLAGEDYVGFENYQKMLSSKKFNGIVTRTFVWMFFSVSLKLIIGLIGAKFFSLVAFIPKKLLWPAVFIFAMIGSYSFSSSMFDVWVMLTFGVIGYFMSRHGFSAAPLVMGLILGKLVEESFSQSMIIHDNNFFALLDKPIVVFFFILAFLSLTTPLWTKVFKKN